MNQQVRRPNPILFMAILLAMLVGFNYLLAPKAEEPSYAEIKALFEDEKVKSFTLSDRTLRLTLHEEKNGKAVVDNTLCVGCGVCRQLCRFDAFKEGN